MYNDSEVKSKFLLLTGHVFLKMLALTGDLKEMKSVV